MQILIAQALFVRSPRPGLSIRRKNNCCHGAIFLKRLPEDSFATKNGK